jgi:mRNA-capping enzyme
MLEDEIIRPRYHEKKQFESGAKSNPLYKYDMELFSVSDSRISFWIMMFNPWVLQS